MIKSKIVIVVNSSVKKRIGLITVPNKLLCSPVGLQAVRAIFSERKLKVKRVMLIFQIISYVINITIKVNILYGRWQNAFPSVPFLK